MPRSTKHLQTCSRFGRVKHTHGLVFNNYRYSTVVILQLKFEFLSEFPFWISTGEDTSTSSRFTDSGSAKVTDNTSAVISFKLPSILESCGRQPLSSRRSISSSSDEGDTIPFQKGHFSHLQRGCQSTQKASVKSTPDVKSGELGHPRDATNLSRPWHNSRADRLQE